MAEAHYRELVAMAIRLMEEEEEDEEQLLFAAAELAADEMMELEDGEGLAALGGMWVKITVDINEYLEMGDPCFRLHFRMSRAVFDALSEAIDGHLRNTGKLKRERTPVKKAVLMVIWLMATPDSFRSVALRFGVRPSTLYFFYVYVIESLRDMAPQFIMWPDAEERRVIREAFEDATSFPGIVGSVDGTHVYVTAPVQDAAYYRNRYSSYSINVQAVVDHRLLVRHIHVGEVGSMHDARVFRRSSLHADLLNRREEFMAMQEHLVGDGAYVLTDYMMIPFQNNGHLTRQELKFNKRLSQCRVRVENSFARAKGKWRRLKFLHARNPANVVNYITAAFVLHNFTILNGEVLLPEEELRQCIRNNQVLGGPENGGDDQDEELNADEDNLLRAARGRGVEKRIYIKNIL